jgi:non-ribosomal peptide synthetase component E (peptide arylation enzyme)
MTVLLIVEEDGGGRMSENIGAALERAYRLFGDREAVIDGGVRWSYRELRHRVAGLTPPWARWASQRATSLPCSR